MKTDDEPIDLSDLDPAVAGLLPNYIRRRVADVGTITELLEAGDFTEIRRLSHNMRGSGSAYGLPKVTAIGTSLEQAAESRNIDEITRLVKDLENFVSQLRFDP